MIKEFVSKWDKNKGKIEDWFKNNHPDSYEEIIKKLFTLVINDSDFDYEHYNIVKLHIIDDGDYRGNQIFIIPKNTYPPAREDYVFTHNSYGSCSGCDTLKAIQKDEPLSIAPSESQVKQYMMLALHLVQKFKTL